MFAGLGFRLAVLLSVALLPLGVISVAQTLRVLGDVRETSHTALMGLTSDAVAGQRGLIEGAFGAARALGPVMVDTIAQPEDCSARARDFVRDSGLFAFAGFMEADGALRCVSEGEALDYGGAPGHLRRLAEPRPEVEIIERGDITGLPVVLISDPVFREGTLRGFVMLSVPYGAIELVGRFGRGATRPERTYLLNHDGAILMPNSQREAALAQLPPRDEILDMLTEGDSHVRNGLTTSGDRVVYVTVPVIPQRIYAIGVWPQDRTPSAMDRSTVLSLIFPFLMWFVSLSVAYFAVHRLVIRHVRHLNGQMRRFAIGEREEFAPNLPGGAPAEFRQLNSTFTKLRRIIGRDEAEIAAALDEKTVLLKEVHHRVKNNLQLIASIVSMQMRKVDDPVMRRVLKSVQERVMSLATIHRILYQSERVADVRADALLQELLAQLSSIGAVPGGEVRVEADLDRIRLYPDQVVPLSLLASEAVTNAYKFIGRPDEDDPWLRVRFKADGEDMVLFEVTNSMGRPLAGSDYREDGTSLGGQLITAFASQLDATPEEGEIETPGGRAYRLSLRFQIMGFIPGDPPGT